MSRLLTPGELADFLQVTEATLADWRYRGRGPRSLRVGRLVRYRQEDVDDWLTAGASGGDPPGAAAIVRLVGGADDGR